MVYKPLDPYVDHVLFLHLLLAEYICDLSIGLKDHLFIRIYRSYYVRALIYLMLR